MTTQSQDPEQEQNPETPQVAQRPKVRRPGWGKSPEAGSDQSPATSPDSSSPSLGQLGSGETGAGAGSGAGPDSPGPSEQKPGDRSRRSGSSPTSSRADREALRQAVRVGFASVTTGAHELLVRDPYAKYAELMLADEQDLDAVSEPGGNLLARRMPKDSPLGGELGDVIALAVGLAGYLLKQIGRIRYARQLRDGGAMVDGLEPDSPQDGAEETTPAEPAPDFPLPQ